MKKVIILFNLLIFSTFCYSQQNKFIVAENYFRNNEYEKAIQSLNSAIIHNPKYAFAYNNRGLAKVRLGQTEEGLADIEKAKSLDDSNAFIYLHLGFYFQKTNQEKLAHQHFQKAKDMEIDFHGIDYLIETTRENEF